MNAFISVFVAMCLILSGGFSSDTPEVPSSKAAIFSDITLTNDGKDYPLPEDLSICLGALTAGSSGLIDFSVRMAEETYLPLQLRAEPDRGISMVFPKSERSYVIESFDALESLGGETGFSDMFTEEDASIAEDLIESFVVVNARDTAAAYRAFFEIYSDVLASVADKGAPVTETIEREGQTFTVDTYTYSITAAQEDEVNAESIRLINEHEVYGKTGMFRATEDADSKGLNIVEHIGADGEFYELTEEYGGAFRDYVLRIGDKITLSYEETTYFDGYSCVSASSHTYDGDRVLSEMRENYFPEEYGWYTLVYDITDSGEGINGTIDLTAPDMDISLRIDPLGADLAASSGPFGLTCRIDVSDGTVIDESLDAKQVVLDSEADILSMGIAITAFESDLDALLKIPEISALIEALYPPDYGMFYEQVARSAEADGLMLLRLSDESIIGVDLPAVDSDEPLDVLSANDIPDGYEFVQRSANLDQRYVNLVLECEKGTLNIVFSDNPDVRNIAEAEPALAKGPYIRHGRNATYITLYRNGSILNVTADFTMTNAEVHRLLGQL